MNNATNVGLSAKPLLKPQSQQNSWLASIIKHKNLAFAGVFVFFAFMFFVGPSVWGSVESNSSQFDGIIDAHVLGGGLVDL